MSWTKSSTAVQAATEALTSRQESPTMGKQSTGKDRLCYQLSSVQWLMIALYQFLTVNTADHHYHYFPMAGMYTPGFYQ